MYNNSKISYKAVFYNEYSSDVLLYWVDYNGIKNQYTPYFKSKTSVKMDSKYFQPWVFKRSNDRSRLFAFTKSENVSIFDGRDSAVDPNSEIHVVINDQGNASFYSKVLHFFV